MLALLVHLAEGAPPPVVRAARLVGDLVVAWDGDRGLTAFAPDSGEPRWQVSLPVAPYGWQPVGVWHGEVVSDSAPTAHLSATGALLATLEHEGLGRCAVHEAGGGAVLACYEGAIVLHPAELRRIGPVLPRPSTCQPGGEAPEPFCGRFGPDTRAIVRVAGVTVVFGEDNSGPHPRHDSPLTLVGIADEGAVRWRRPVAEAREAGAHGELCWVFGADSVEALGCADGTPRWSANAPGATAVHALDVALLVVAPDAVNAHAWSDGRLLWRAPLGPGERAAVGLGTPTVDPVTGEPSQPFVGAGPATVRVLDAATGRPRGSIPLAEGQSLFGLPGGYSRLSDHGDLTLYTEAGAPLNTLRLGGTSRYFTLAADADRLVVTLFDQTFVVDRQRGRIVEKLRGQFHTVALAGKVLVLHRRPLGDAGELRFFR